MLNILAIILIIIFSPVILIAGVFSLFIILGLVYSIISIPIEIVKKMKEDKKQVEVDG